MDHESILPNMESKEDKYFSVCELHFKWGGKKKKKKESYQFYHDCFSWMLGFRYSPYWFCSKHFGVCLVQIWRYQWDEAFAVLLEKTCLEEKIGPYPGIFHTISVKREVPKSTSGVCGMSFLGRSELWSTCSCAGGSFNIQGSIGKRFCLLKKVLPKFSVISDNIAVPKFSMSFFVLNWSYHILCPISADYTL